MATILDRTILEGSVLTKPHETLINITQLKLEPTKKVSLCRNGHRLAVSCAVSASELSTMGTDNQHTIL